MHDSDSWELGRVKGDPECTLLLLLASSQQRARGTSIAGKSRRRVGTVLAGKPACDTALSRAGMVTSQPQDLISSQLPKVGWLQL